MAKAQVDCSELAKSLTQVARTMAELDDVKTFDDVVAKMKASLPGIDRPEIVEAIHATRRWESSQKPPTVKSKIAKIEEDAVVEAGLRDRLSRLADDAEKMISSPKNKRSIKERNETIKALRRELSGLAGKEGDLKRIAALEEQIKTGVYPKRQPRQEPVTVEQKRVRELEKDLSNKKSLERADETQQERIARLEGELKTGERPPVVPPKEGPRTALKDKGDVLSGKVKEQRTQKGIKDQIADLENQFKTGRFKDKEGRPTDDSSEAVKALRAVRKQAQRRVDLASDIKDMIDQLETGNLKEKEKPTKIVDEQIENLEFERDRLRREINRRIESKKPRSTYQKWVGEPGRLLANFITTGEFSAIGNQAAVALRTNPIKTTKAIPAGLRAMLSEKNEYKIQKALESRPNALNGNYHRADLDITTSDRIGKHEETALSAIIEKLPVFGAFNRFHRNFLNVLRADIFDGLVGVLPGGKGTSEELKALGHVANISTGRGNIKYFAKAMDVLGDVAFAPRYNMSRIQFLTGQPIWSAPKGAVRNAIIKQYARYAVAQGAIRTALFLIGAQVEDDPRSTAFEKVKIGKTLHDINGGMGSYVTLATRLLSGQTKTQRGEITNIADRTNLPLPSFMQGGPVDYGKVKAGDYGARFLRGKLGVVPGVATDLLTGTNWKGDPLKKADLLERFAGPISYRDIYKALQAGEWKLDPEAAMNLLAMFGDNLQTIEDQNRKQKPQSAQKAQKQADQLSPPS